MTGTADSSGAGLTAGPDLRPQDIRDVVARLSGSKFIGVVSSREIAGTTSYVASGPFSTFRCFRTADGLWAVGKSGQTNDGPSQWWDTDPDEEGLFQEIGRSLLDDDGFTLTVLSQVHYPDEVVVWNFETSLGKLQVSEGPPLEELLMGEGSGTRHQHWTFLEADIATGVVVTDLERTYFYVLPVDSTDALP